MNPPMKRTLALALLLAAACGGPASREAPSFSLPELGSGRTTELASLRGRPVLLNFWATWCPDCVEELPALEALHKRRAPEGLAVLGINLDDAPAKDAPPYLKKLGVTYPQLIGDKAVTARYAVRGLPVTVLVDAEGRLVRRWTGPVTLESVENDILPLLKRRPS